MQMPQVYLIKANFTQVTFGSIQMWFSYQTMIAFRCDNNNTVIAKNRWSNTTGKHLNHIDGGSAEAKAKRLELVEFAEQFEKQTKNMVVGV